MSGMYGSALALLGLSSMFQWLVANSALVWLGSVSVEFCSGSVLAEVEVAHWLLGFADWLICFRSGWAWLCSGSALAQLLVALSRLCSSGSCSSSDQCGNVVVGV